MAKLKDGFYKQTASSIGSDLLVLLAGGGAKPISDFALANGTNATGTWNIDISGNAKSSTQSKYLLTGAGTECDANTLAFSDHLLRWYSSIPSTSSNLPTVTGWQNGLLALPLHSNGVTAQLYFSATKALFYRSMASDDWHQIAYKTDILTKTSQLINDSGYVTGGPYLPLSGGTLTSSSVPLHIDRTDSNSYTLIGYRNTSKDLGYLGFSNYGDLVVSPNRQNGNTNYYAIWHSGNDGSGSGLDADLLDGYHEFSFLRYRDLGSNGGATLWSQIGIRSYHGALPEGLSGIYNYGEVVSLPGSGSRLDIFTNHVGSSESGGQGGLWWRSGWNDEKRPWRRIIDSGNIANQSVSYAASAGNADTVDNLHASDFVRAYGTYSTSYSYDSDWGQSIVTFDPIVSGTAPAQNPNISILNIGNAYSRRKQLAFTYSTNDIYYRRRVDSSWSGWVRLAIAGESYTKGDSDGRYYPISGNVNMSGDNKWIGSTMGGGTDYWRIGGSGTSDNGVCQITIGDNSNDYFQIVIADYTGTNYTALQVKAGGTYAPHFYENSDQRLKTNIQTILNKDNIPQIKEFDWKESGEHSYGLIAQELEEQGYSELVSTKDDGYKTVNYSAALSLIVGKLQVKIKELEKEIEILKNKN